LSGNAQFHSDHISGALFDRRLIDFAGAPVYFD
jgi:hypothetical protein